jgi:hypothetical protein
VNVVPRTCILTILNQKKINETHTLHSEIADCADWVINLYEGFPEYVQANTSSSTLKD